MDSKTEDTDSKFRDMDSKTEDMDSKVRSAQINRRKRSEYMMIKKKSKRNPSKIGNVTDK